jgi:hypothetical protein
MNKEDLHRSIKHNAFLSREAHKEAFFLKWNATVESFEFFRKAIDQLIATYRDTNKELDSSFYAQIKILKHRQERESLGMKQLGDEGIKESYFV